MLHHRGKAKMTAELHRAKAKKLLKRIGMAHVIPYLVPAAGHFMVSGNKSLIHIEGVTDLPLELDMMILLPMLVPNFLPLAQHRPLQRGEIPSFVSVRERRAHLMKVFRALQKTFTKLLKVSKSFRVLLLEPFFRRTLYYQWYTSPIEGLDGRPDYSLRHGENKMEVPRPEVPGLIDMTDEYGNPYQRLNARWYRIFLRTVAFNYDLRFKYLTTYRAQRLLTLGLVNLGGNTPQLMQVCTAWRKGSEKRRIPAGLYIEHKPDIARRVSGLLITEGNNLSGTSYQDMLYAADARKFLEQNGMLSPNMIERLVNQSVSKTMTSTSYYGKWWRKTTSVAYEKYVGPGHQIVVYNDGNRITRTLEIEVLRVPTVLRPQAFFVGETVQSKKTIGFNRSYHADTIIRFGVTQVQERHPQIPVTTDLFAIPETLLIWDKPVVLDLKIQTEQTVCLTQKLKRYLEPTILNIGTITIGENLNVDFMRLANPIRTKKVLLQLLSHLDYPNADKAMKLKHPKILIDWGLVTMGPKHERPFHIYEELDAQLKVEKLKENFPGDAALPLYQMRLNMKLPSQNLPEGQQRVYRSEKVIREHNIIQHKKMIKEKQMRIDKEQKKIDKYRQEIDEYQQIINKNKRKLDEL